MIALADVRIPEADLDVVRTALRGGAPDAVERFEAAFAEHLGVGHVVAMDSCTAALQLAYLAAGVVSGDEVVVPTYTFVATASTAVHCGAAPVFADVVGADDLSVDPDHVAALIGPRTRAVCCVHFAGFAAPVDELRELCAAHGVALIEDAAHAPASTGGASGRALGAHGLAGCFSFFSNKVLAVGEGGAVCTDDGAVAARLRALRAVGRLDCELDAVRAALLLARLVRLDAEVAARRDRVARYRRLLAGVAGVSVPYRSADLTAASCYVMPVLLDDAGRRDAVRAALRDDGVQTSVLYPAVHTFTAYRGEPALPRAEAAAAAEITLPLYAHLTDDDQDRVVDALARAAGP